MAIRLDQIPEQVKPIRLDEIPEQKKPIRLDEIPGPELAVPVPEQPVQYDPNAFLNLPESTLPEPNFSQFTQTEPNQVEPIEGVPTGTPVRPSLLGRLGKSFWNAAIAAPAQVLKTKSSVGEMNSILNSMSIAREDFTKRLYAEEPITPGELAWYENSNSDLGKEVRRRKEAGTLIIKEKSKLERIKSLEENLQQGKNKTISDADISFTIDAAQGIKEKAVDVIAGVGGFVAQIAALRKAFPGMPEALIWEVQSEVNGAAPGEGAATYALFSGPQKVLGKLSPASKAGKAAKAVATTGAESATLAGLTAAKGGSTEDILISAGIPLGMKALGGASKKIVGKKQPIKPVGKPKVRVKAEIGKVTVNPMQQANKELIDWIGKAKTISGTTVKEELHKLRARQATESKNIRTEALKQGKSFFEARRLGKQGFKDKAPIIQIKPPKLSRKQWELYEKKSQEYYKDYEFKLHDVGDALDRIRQGRILQPHQFELIEPVMGKEVTKALHKGMSEVRNFTPWDLPGIASAVAKLFVSTDIQFVRQGSSFAARHPIRYVKASAISAKAYAYQKYADKINAGVKANPNHLNAKERGLNFIETSSYSTNRAEWYSFGLGERMVEAGAKRGRVAKTALAPIRLYGRIIHRAERAFAAGTNSFLQGLWDSEALNLDKLNISAAERKALEESYAKTLNVNMKILRTENATGNQIKNAANFLVFSTSVTASRPLQVAAPLRYKGYRIYAASLVASNVAKIMGVSAIISGMADMYRLAYPDKEAPVDSSTNVLSSDWGKTVVKNTRYDFTGGDATFYRTLARLAVGAYVKGKQAVTGELDTKVGDQKIRPVGETIGQYAISRQAPALSFAKAVLTGKDFIGDSISLPEAFLRSVTPEQLQAMYDAWEKDGTLQALAAGAAAQLSTGVQTYEVNPASQRYQTQDKLAAQKYGKAWEDLTKNQQEVIKATNEKTFTLLDESVRAFRKTKPYNPERQKKEQRVAGGIVKSKLPQPVRDMLKGIDLMPSRRHEGFYLNDKRYNQYLENLAEELSKLEGRAYLKGLSVANRTEAIQDEINLAKDQAWFRLESGIK